MKIFVVLIIIMMPVKVVSQSKTDFKTIYIRKTADFQITGGDSTNTWRLADWIDLPKTEGTADYRTRVKLLYSEKGIYCRFDCGDRKITATKKEDFADLWLEDVVEIFFWTDESYPVYFEYELSPLNRELAILVPNFDGEFLGWKPWKYEGERKAQHAVNVYPHQTHPQGWTAVFFIPYALLKPLQNVPPQKGMQWRVNMYRIDYDGDSPSEWAWQPVTKTFHEYQAFGKMIFD